MKKVLSLLLIIIFTVIHYPTFALSASDTESNIDIPIGQIVPYVTSLDYTNNVSLETVCAIANGYDDYTFGYWTTGGEEKPYAMFYLGGTYYLNTFTLVYTIPNTYDVYDIYVSEDGYNWSLREVDYRASASVGHNNVVLNGVKASWVKCVRKSGVYAYSPQLCEVAANGTPVKGETKVLCSPYDISSTASSRIQEISNSIGRTYGGDAELTLDGDLYSSYWCSDGNDTASIEYDLGEVKSLYNAVMYSSGRSGYAVDVYTKSDETEEWQLYKGNVVVDGIVESAFNWYEDNPNVLYKYNFDLSDAPKSRYIKFARRDVAPWVISEMCFNVVEVNKVLYPLDRANWQASAYSTSAEYPTAIPALAINNNLDAGNWWESGDTQSSGDWFMIDMGANYKFDQLTIFGSVASSVMGQKMDIAVSKNGLDFKTVQQVEVRRYGQTLLNTKFAPITAQYIKITLLNNNNALWNINDIRVYSSTASTNKTKSATANYYSLDNMLYTQQVNTPASYAIDGNPETYADFGSASSGKDGNVILELDFGEVYEDINRVDITFKDASSTGPEYKIDVSMDGINWGTVFRDYPDGVETRATFPPVSARYLRFVPIARPMSYISEINVLSDASIAFEDEEEEIPDEGKTLEILTVSDSEYLENPENAIYPAFVDNMPYESWTTKGKEAYYQIKCTGGKKPYHFELVNGALPDGLFLTDDGKIQGIPSVEETTEFTVKVTDSNGKSVSKALSMTANPYRAKWFEDARFGAMIQWTLWEDRNEARVNIDIPSYEKRIENWNADSWAEQLEQMNVKVLNMTFLPGDGIRMWPSKAPTQKELKTQRNMAKELIDACHKRGIKVIAYVAGDYSWIGAFDKDLKTGTEYDLTINMARELIELGIDGLWFDGGWIKGINDFDRLVANIRATNPFVTIQNNPGIDFGGHMPGYPDVDIQIFECKEIVDSANADQKTMDDLLRVGFSSSVKKKTAVEVTGLLGPRWGWEKDPNQRTKLKSVDAIIKNIQDNWDQGATYLLNWGVMDDGTLVDPVNIAPSLNKIMEWVDENITPTDMPQASVSDEDVFAQPVRVELTSEEGAEIYYTLDGSIPDKNSILYQEPICIDKSVQLKACAYTTDKHKGKSRIMQQNYIFSNTESESLLTEAYLPSLFEADKSRMKVTAISDVARKNAPYLIDGEKNGESFVMNNGALLLDLGGMYITDSIVLYAMNQAESSESDFDIAVSEDGTAWESVSVAEFLKDNGKIEIKMPENTYANYVKITANNSLVISEMDIHGVELIKSNDNKQIGMVLKVGNAPLSLHGIGRFYTEGNSGIRKITLCRDVFDNPPLWSDELNVDTAVVEQDGFQYVDVAGVILEANKAYVIMCEENGEEFYFAAQPQKISTKNAYLIDGVSTDNTWTRLYKKSMPGGRYEQFLNIKYQTVNEFELEDNGKNSHLFSENFDSYSENDPYETNPLFTWDSGSQRGRHWVNEYGALGLYGYSRNYTKVDYNGLLPDNFVTEFDFTFPQKKIIGSGETYLSVGYRSEENVLEAVMNFESKTALLQLNGAVVHQTPFTFNAGKWYMFKGVKAGNGYYVKIWGKGESEPVAWTLGTREVGSKGCDGLYFKQYSANYPGNVFIDNIVFDECSETMRITLFSDNFHAYSSVDDLVASQTWTFDEENQPDRIWISNGAVLMGPYDGNHCKMVYNHTLPENFTTEFDFSFPEEKNRGNGETSLSVGYTFGENLLEAVMNFESKTALLRLNGAVVDQTTFAFDVAKWYNFQGVKAGNGYYVKIWEKGALEPASWTVCKRDSKIAGNADFSLKQYSENYPGNVFIDNLSISLRVEMSLDCGLSEKKVGDTYQGKIHLNPELILGDVIWESSDTEVITVSNAGIITAVGNGKATITAICGNLVGTCDVVVSTANPSLYAVGADGNLTQIGTICTGTVRVVQNISGLNSDGQLITALVDTETNKVVTAMATSFSSNDKSVYHDIAIDSTKYQMKSFLWNNSLVPLREVFTLVY